jgi:hypothetical protein
MVDTFLLPRNHKINRANFLLDATIRDFSGGWNTIDADLNLSTKFSKILYNMQRGIDGANEIRPGTVLFAETEDELDEIIGVAYHSNFLIAVGKNGKVVRIASDGTVRVIFDANIASSLLGSPDPWDTGVSFVSFATFNGELIICNGINKPLIINTAVEANYLHDLADLSNANVPIAKYVTTLGRYLIMGGDPLNEDLLHISNTDTSGTWFGASSPNDGTQINLGSRVTLGSHRIKGLGRHRDKLLVAFEDVTLPGTLGEFSEANHIPTFDDVIENHGSISHLVIQTIGEDMLFCDPAGVSAIRRALFTGNVKPDRFSQLIDPEIRRDISRLKLTSTLENKTFSLYDSLADNYMLFIPDADGDAEITEYRCFVFKKNDTLKIESWQEYRNWKFRCGCRSALKSIFMCEGTQVFRLGNNNVKGDPHKDYEGDQEMWSDDTPWSDYTGFTPVADVKDSGIPIRFIWELPWSDNKERFLVKNSRYINFDTEGDNKFTAQMYVDNIYIDASDLGEDWIEDTLLWDDDLGFDVDVLDPALEMDFEGGDAPGFGRDEFGDDFGGGRPTRLENLYAWVAKYKLSKLRMQGDGIEALKFISITVAYLQGSSRR